MTFQYPPFCKTAIFEDGARYISKSIISISYELETKPLCQNKTFLEEIMCCVTFDLSVILKDGPIKQYYCLCLMIYVLSNLIAAIVEIVMYGSNDLKMALRYSVKRTELANSNIGLLITKLCHNILKTPNMFIHPHPTPSKSHWNGTAL